MSTGKNVAAPAQQSQDVILEAHAAVIAALDQIEALIAAVEPLEVTERAKDKAAIDERWEVTTKIGSTLVRHKQFCKSS
jgi:hypothetical protein